MILSLDALRPQPHRLREFFRQHDITAAMLAQYLGRTVVTARNYLNGTMTPPAAVERKMEDLARLITEGQNPGKPEDA